MKKSKLYLILAIIISLTLFTTAAICNQCAAAPAEEESTIEEVTEEAAEEEEGSKTLESDEEKAAEEESEEEEPPEEEPAEEEAENIETEAPTINLEIYEGPTYSSSDNVCYYRIKAIVTGKPAPTVEFSKDDSGGAWGTKKVQVNLSNSSDTYTLTATATNSEGTATDSMNLIWQCQMQNNPPEITEIEISPGTIFIGSTIDVKVIANDPDGDILNYEWTAAEGSFADENANDTEYIVPGNPGSYQITVKVSDGNGGTDEKTKQIIISPPPQTQQTMEVPRDENGFIVKDIKCTINFPLFVGDSVENKPIRGFVSFDITGLTGATIDNATLKFADTYQHGDPYDHLIEAFWVWVVDWGDDYLELGDFDLPPQKSLGEYSNPDITINNHDLKDALQTAIDNGKEKFQIMIKHKGWLTNNNNTYDTVSFPQGSIKLNVEYTGF